MNKHSLFVFLLFCLITQAGWAQNHPLINGPVRSEGTGEHDVEMIRTAISISEKSGAIPGMSFVHVSSESPESEWVEFNAVGFAVSRVSMLGDVPEWHQTDGKLTVQLPERNFDTAGRFEWVLKIEFLIAEGISVRATPKSRIAAWDGSALGSDIWYPTPSDQLDSYLTQLRVSVPKFWEVWVGDGELTSHPERVVDGYSKRPVFAGAVSFFAYDSRQAQPSEFEIPVLLEHNSGIRSFIDSFGSNEKTALQYFESYDIPPRFPAFGFAVTEGLKAPVHVGSRLLTSPEFFSTGNPWVDEFYGLHAVVEGMTDAVFDSLLPTDSWISDAIPLWISLQAFQNSAGEDAAGYIYETLRDDYLEEAQTYRRPLVWDRWTHPSDLLDSHAKGKGAWVFRMLTERLGVETMNEAIARFMDIARTETVDSETLRETLELVSGEELTLFFDVWVYSAGHPELSLGYQFKAGTETTEVTIKQHQSGDLVPEAFEFDLTLQYSSLEGVNSSLVRLNKREQVATIKTSIIPRYVFPDAFGAVLFDYSEPLKRDDIVAQLRDAVGPVSKIRSLRYLTKMRPDPAVLLGLRLFLQNETEPAVLGSACEMLAEMAPSASALSLLIDFSTHPDPRVQFEALRALSAFPNEEKAFNVALNAANTGTDAAVLSQAVSTIVKLRPSLTWSLVQSALVTPSEGDLVARTALGLVHSGITEDRNLFEAIRPLTEDGNAILLRIAALEAFARIDSGGQTVKKTIEAWLKSDDYSLKAAALEVLQQYDDVDIKRESLAPLAAQEWQPDLMRQYAKILSQ